MFGTENLLITTIKAGIISFFAILLLTYLILIIIGFFTKTLEKHNRIFLGSSLIVSSITLVPYFLGSYSSTFDPVTFFATSVITAKYMMLPIYLAIPLIVLAVVQKIKLFNTSLVKRGLIFRNHQKVIKNSKKWGVFILIAEAITIISNIFVFFVYVKTPLNIIQVYGIPFLLLSTVILTLTIYVGAKLIHPDFF